MINIFVLHPRQFDSASTEIYLPPVMYFSHWLAIIFVAFLGVFSGCLCSRRNLFYPLCPSKRKKKKTHKQTMQYTRCFGNGVYVCLLQFWITYPAGLYLTLFCGWFCAIFTQQGNKISFEIASSIKVYVKCNQKIMHAVTEIVYNVKLQYSINLYYIISLDHRRYATRAAVHL